MASTACCAGLSGFFVLPRAHGESAIGSRKGFTVAVWNRQHALSASFSKISLREESGLGRWRGSSSSQQYTLAMSPRCLAVAVEEEEEETEEEIEAAYRALYGDAYSSAAASAGSDSGEEGADADGNDTDRFRRRRDDAEDGDDDGFRGPKDGFEEQVLQVRRVTKVVKGGKQLSFRAVVVVGNKKDRVGVGVGKAKEVIYAVNKAVLDAKRHMIKVPLTKYLTFPHRVEGTFGAAKVMLRPAAVGTGIIAGGAVRVVLELAGVENALGKQLGSENPLNNARAVLDGISQMKQFRDVAKERGIAMEELWK
eukprot:TRINITY_DN4121_c0_g1_i1.p1 TRINITY_DN4121_c0_g1~~TRINITY_DN4121_c0_g1_i1.p1  ORF type:complete len:332 (+),score=91.51 TRINITY_DN4121_c0_g1_i1:67-996(+)